MVCPGGTKSGNLVTFSNGTITCALLNLSWVPTTRPPVQEPGFTTTNGLGDPATMKSAVLVKTCSSQECQDLKRDTFPIPDMKKTGTLSSDSAKSIHTQNKKKIQVLKLELLIVENT